MVSQSCQFQGLPEETLGCLLCVLRPLAVSEQDGIFHFPSKYPVVSLSCKHPVLKYPVFFFFWFVYVFVFSLPFHISVLNFQLRWRLWMSEKTATQPWNYRLRPSCPVCFLFSRTCTGCSYFLVLSICSLRQMGISQSIRSKTREAEAEGGYPQVPFVQKGRRNPWLLSFCKCFCNMTWVPLCHQQLPISCVVLETSWMAADDLKPL